MLRSWMAVLALVLLCLPPISAAEPMRVIAHSGVGEDELSVSTLRAIFSMRVRSWSDKQAVHVYVLPDRHDAHIAFSKSVLRIYPYVLRDTWDRMVFTGTGQAPIEVANMQILIRLVAETPGAIGYINEEIPSNEKLKILEIR